MRQRDKRSYLEMLFHPLLQVCPMMLHAESPSLSMRRPWLAPGGHGKQQLDLVTGLSRVITDGNGEINQNEVTQAKI